MIFISESELEEKIKKRVEKHVKEQLTLERWKYFHNNLKVGMHVEYDGLNYEVAHIDDKWIYSDCRLLILKIGDQQKRVALNHKPDCKFEF